ncbi:hornerin-like [Cydia splendana]|uniref:hornerin-like n=1 Tax=Cydia splendana TaxID=1100963 RepID=UPI00300CC210
MVGSCIPLAGELPRPAFPSATASENTGPLSDLPWTTFIAHTPPLNAIPHNETKIIRSRPTGCVRAPPATRQSQRRHPSDYDAFRKNALINSSAYQFATVVNNRGPATTARAFRPAPPFIPARGMASVRTRSASPKSVSFSPVLERKYSIDRAPSSPPELKSQDWRKYFADFSAYLDALLADLQNSINPGARVGSPGRTGSPGGRTASPGARTASPGGRTSSPGGRSSPGGSLSSPTSTGYGSILNGSRNTDYNKSNSPTYQNTGSLEKVIPVKYTNSTSGYGGHTPYSTGQSGYGRTTGGRGNLSELDTLLDDLSNARYGSYGDKTPTSERVQQQLATVHGGHTPYSTGQSGYGRTTGGRGNLSELDTLLDDLSNARYGSYGDKTPTSERVQQQLAAVHGGHTPYSTGQSGYGRTTGGRGNLSELDTLLDDLSNARYGSYGDKTPTSERDGYGRTNGAASPASARPTVDSLLDQLSTDLHNG